MVIIEGWAVWNIEAWCVEYSNIYPTKKLALEAASKHYSYIGDDVDEHSICEVKIKYHTKHLLE